MLAYAERLDALLKPHPHGSTCPGEVIAPLFVHAQGSDGDVAEENRAALTALAAYLSGISLRRCWRATASRCRRHRACCCHCMGGATLPNIS